MHPDLVLGPPHTLSTLEKRLVLGPGLSHPSPQDVEDLFTNAGPLTGPCVLRLLRVYFILLHPARIPDEADLDSCHVRIVHIVNAALCAVKAVCYIRNYIPRQLCEDLWPRLWSWVNFALTYHEFLIGILPQDTLPSAKHLALSCLHLASVFIADPQYQHTIVHVPDFYRLATRAWVWLLESPLVTASEETNVAMVLQFLGDPHANAAQMIDAAGGMYPLAKLVAAQFDAVCPNRSSAIPDGKRHILRYLVYLLIALDTFFYRSSEPERLWVAIIPLGIVPRLINTSENLLRTLTTQSALVLRKCLYLLVKALRSRTGYRTLGAAIRSGLLYLIVSCARHQLEPETSDSLVILLQRVLAPATIFYHVLDALQEVLPPLLDDTPPFPPNILEAWNALTDSAVERFPVLAKLQKNTSSSRRACDNLDCRVICEKTDLRCCSRCQYSLYCSLTCQLADWRQGHRDTCAAHRDHRARYVLRYGYRERAFFSALLNRDYQSHRTSIASHLATLWASVPDAHAFTLFDYRSGTLHISLVTHEYLVANSLLSPSVSDQVNRASRSGGLMSFDLMLVPEGYGEYCWITPRRTSTSSLYNQLKLIAAQSTEPEDIFQHVKVTIQDDDAESVY
ncbi:hypothetical protein B0H11DRAFT_2249462 [Mycena galericulata]|nr:hypothetical protein B0H11DRAFT_2249462 [Mycena galericulata]